MNQSDEIPWSNNDQAKEWHKFENSCYSITDRNSFSKDAHILNTRSFNFVFIYDPELMVGGKLYQKYLGQDPDNMYLGKSALKHADHFENENEEVAALVKSSGYRFAKRPGALRSGLVQDGTLLKQQDTSKYVHGDLWAVPSDTIFKLDVLYENGKGDLIRSQKTRSARTREQYPTEVKLLENDGKSLKSVWVYMLKHWDFSPETDQPGQGWLWHVGGRCSDNENLKKKLKTTFNVDYFR